MRTILTFLVVLVAVCCCVSAERKRCNTGDDCDDGECCLVRNWMPFRRGDCTKLATENESCSHEDDLLNHYGEKYIASCPCEQGLSCEPEEIKDFPLVGTVKLNERCVSDVGKTAVEEATTSQAEV